MQTVVIVVHLMIVAATIAMVLLQTKAPASAWGGALASCRAVAPPTFPSRTTAILAVFFLSSPACS